MDLGGQEFSEHCHAFAQSKGNALVEVGRGDVSSLIKYINAVRSLSTDSPFVKLSAAGLMPERTQPRARVLQVKDLPAWRETVDKLRAEFVEVETGKGANALEKRPELRYTLE